MTASRKYLLLPRASGTRKRLIARRTDARRAGCPNCARRYRAYTPSVEAKRTQHDAGAAEAIDSYKIPGINAFTRRRYSGYCTGKVSIINFSSTRLLSQ